MKANKFAKNDEGVSAVIGVILMVAITVILAAVIAAFVFGMVGNVNQKKNPAFTVKRVSNAEIDITLQDMGGASTINSFSVTNPADVTDTWITGDDTATTLGVGDSAKLEGAVGGTVHLVATAVVDGTTQVVIDTNA